MSAFPAGVGGQESQSVAAGRGGGKGGIRPGRHCAGGGIWRSKNMEFLNCAVSGELAT